MGGEETKTIVTIQIWFTMVPGIGPGNKEQYRIGLGVAYGIKGLWERETVGVLLCLVDTNQGKMRHYAYAKTKLLTPIKKLKTCI